MKKNKIRGILITQVVSCKILMKIKKIKKLYQREESELTGELSITFKHLNNKSSTLLMRITIKMDTLLIIQDSLTKWVRRCHMIRVIYHLPIT